LQNYDVVIKSHKKDYYKLPYVISSLKHLRPAFDNIYLVSEDGYVPDCDFMDKIIPIKDKEVAPYIDKSRFKYRYNWAWVNMLSLTQEFTKNDLYFDVQADQIFLKDIELFDGGGRPRIFTTKANMANNGEWTPYFNFSRDMFGIDKITHGSSYIIEFMMYDKNKLKKLYENYESKQSMIELSYESINPNSYPADQEIFGNLIEKDFSDQYEIVGPIETYITGKFAGENDPHEFLKYIEGIKQNYPNAIACSFHTYWMPDGQE